MGRLTFTYKPLPSCTDLCLLWDALINVKHMELQSLPLSELPPQEEGEPPREPLGILGALSPELSTPSDDTISMGVTSPSHFPIGYSLVQTLHAIIYFAGTSQRPDGFPWPSRMPRPSGFHLLLHHSIHNSSTAFLTSIYSCCYLCHSPGQLTGPVKLNLMSLALSKGSTSLYNHLPRNKIASPSARTTASAIHSSRPSWDMSAISSPLHAWEGGGWMPPPSLKTLWHECNQTSNCLGSLSMPVYPQMIENAWRAIYWIVQIWRVLWETCLFALIPPPTRHGWYPLAHLLRTIEWGIYPSGPFCLPLVVSLQIPIL